MKNYKELQFEVFDKIQTKLEEDEKFAKEFYKGMFESIFHTSELMYIEDFKLGEPCEFKVGLNK